VASGTADDALNTALSHYGPVKLGWIGGADSHFSDKAVLYQ